MQLGSFRIICQRVLSPPSGGSSATGISGKTVSVTETLTNEMNVSNMHMNCKTEAKLIIVVVLLDWYYFYWHTSTVFSHRL
jgi:hypothetical protein